MTYVGRLDRKGLDWLLETAARWLPQLDGCDLLLVGDGPERRQLEAQCGRLGLCGLVHFAGWQPNIPEIMAASRLLLLPSAWEGMPNVVLERMASRLPVVAADVEGVGELLEPAAAEQTVHFGDTEAFAAKLIRFVKEAATAAETGARNRLRAEECFTLDLHGRRHTNRSGSRFWQAIAEAWKKSFRHLGRGPSLEVLCWQAARATHGDGADNCPPEAGLTRAKKRISLGLCGRGGELW